MDILLRRIRDSKCARLTYMPRLSQPDENSCLNLAEANMSQPERDPELHRGERNDEEDYGVGGILLWAVSELLS